MDNKVDGTVVNKKLLMLLLAAVPCTSAFADVNLYGQVNRTINIADDGIETSTLFADNDASNTRFGMTGDMALNDTTSAGAKIELSVVSASNADVNNMGNTGTSIGVRHADTWMDTCFGKFSLGHGSMATDDAAETNLANTWNTAYSYADAGAGMRFHESGNDRADTTDPEVSTVISNFDGGRKPRFRYDTPEFNGFKVAAAIGSDGPDAETTGNSIRYDNDIALTYSGSVSSFDVAAALGYDKVSHGGNARSEKNAMFSASALHNPTGLSLSFSTGKKHHNADGRKNATFWYGNLGYQSDLMAYGKSYFAVDYYKGSHLAVDHGKSQHMGVAMEQALDKVNSTAYVAARRYKYKTNTLTYDTVSVFFVGLKVKFGAKLA